MPNHWHPGSETKGLESISHRNELPWVHHRDCGEWNPTSVDSDLTRYGMEATRREGLTLTFPALNVNRRTLNTNSMDFEIKGSAGPWNWRMGSTGSTGIFVDSTHDPRLSFVRRVLFPFPFYHLDENDPSRNHTYKQTKHLQFHCFYRI